MPIEKKNNNNNGAFNELLSMSPFLFFLSFFLIRKKNVSMACLLRWRAYFVVNTLFSLNHPIEKYVEQVLFALFFLKLL